MRFWRRHQGGDEIEARLREERPQPSNELVRRISEQVDASPAPVRPGTLRLGFAAAATAGLLVVVIALGGVGGSLNAARDVIQLQNAGKNSPQAKGKPAGDQYDEKVTICHRPPGNPSNGQTLRLPQSAAEAHLRNHPGDTLGPCPGQLLAAPGDEDAGAAPDDAASSVASETYTGAEGSPFLPFTGRNIVTLFWIGLLALLAGLGLRTAAGQRLLHRGRA